MKLRYYNRIAFIFVLSICVNIYNINCGCFCNSCKGNTTSGNGGGIKKIIIKVTADSITIDGEILNKLEEDNKPKNVVYPHYLTHTNIYNVDDIDFNNNYETVIEDNDFKNKTYVIAIVEVKEYSGKLEHYIISCLNNTIYGLFLQCKTIKRILILKSENVTDMSLMFYGCSALEELKLNNFNTSKVTNMGSMFKGCNLIKELNLSSFNTSNVTDMGSMFYGCSSLINLNLNSFNTSNVTNMSYMFSECSSLINLNLENFNTSNVINMSGMFCGCTLLKELNINNFNTNEETYMCLMFDGCKDLKSIIKPNDTSKAGALINLINATLKLKK